MAYAETQNAQAHGPEIWERLSELEERERSARGSLESDRAADGGDLRGYTVLNPTGHVVGTVEDLYVDPNTREPYFALLSLGNRALGVGNRKVLVNVNDMEIGGDRQVRVRAALG